jgi:dTDP-4-amino-4,6-dideoxygalactose transaminase
MLYCPRMTSPRSSTPTTGDHDRPPTRLDELSIFGGRASFAEPRHVGRPNIGDRARLLKRIDRAVERRWLANDGPLIAEFEGRVAELVGIEHCIATGSATVGLQLVARALGLTGEVIMPAFTFIGTAHAMSWLGLTPVFAEIDPRTHNVDPGAVDGLVTSATSAIIGVHLWGRPCDVYGLHQVADRHGLPLLFDAAHALGCSHDTSPIGGSGRAEVFSFHATKVATAAEGGAITTRDPELAARVRSMRNFGFVGYDRVSGIGTNAKMNELSAAMGLTSLDALDSFIAVNRDHAARYAAALAEIPGVRLIDYPTRERHNYHYIVAEVDDPVLRDQLVTVLHAENVLVRRYFAPGCHRMEPYLAAGTSLPLTEALADRVLVLPTGTAVTDQDIRIIAAIISLVVEHAPEVCSRQTV